MRRSLILAVLLVVASAGLVVRDRAAHAELASPVPPLGITLGGPPSFSTTLAGTMTLTQVGKFRPAAGLHPRVALISSGVDADVFPAPSPRDKITVPWGWSATDVMGYGTYVASVILQLDPGATVTSYSIYPSGAPDLGKLRDALAAVVGSYSSFDVVLAAFPPSDLLDPITASMGNGSWGELTDAISSAPRDGADGPLFGIPL